MNETTVNGTSAYLVTAAIDGKINHTKGNGSQDKPYEVVIDKK